MKTSLQVPKNILNILFDRNEAIKKADGFLSLPNMHITDITSPLSAGTAKDYFSTGDYWWPNPDTPDSLPFIRRDGMSWPGGFLEHRQILRNTRARTAALAAAYHMTGNEDYAGKAIQMLCEFFIDPKTGMNASLLYSQAIQGICTGRCIGVIDTLHLIDVPFAIDALKHSVHMSSEIYRGLKQWFADYLDWLMKHPFGIEEMNQHNNHSVCWNVQAACFATFTGNEECIELCRRRYKEIYLPDQMSADGSFPRELSRTKPYAYSNFVLDNMVNICMIVPPEPSASTDDLWKYTLNDGRNIKKGLEFMLPYLEDINKWPFEKDVQHFEEFPVAMSYLLFTGLKFNDERYLNIYRSCKSKDHCDEIIRNSAVSEPYLYLIDTN